MGVKARENHKTCYAHGKWKVLGLWQNINFWLTCEDCELEASGVCPSLPGVTQVPAANQNSCWWYIGYECFLNRLLDVSNCITQLLLSYTF